MPATLCASAIQVVIIANSLGGVVTFNPPSLTLDNSLGDSRRTVDVTLSGPPSDPVFGFDLVLESEAVPITGWNYVGPTSLVFCDPFPCHHQFLPGLLILDHVTVQTAFPLPVTVASMTLDSTGVPNGEYDVAVDSEHSRLRLLLGSSELTGSMRITVVPEPSAWLMLSVLGAFVVMCRRGLGRVGDISAHG